MFTTLLFAEACVLSGGQPGGQYTKNTRGNALQLEVEDVRRAQDKTRAYLRTKNIDLLTDRGKEFLAGQGTAEVLPIGSRSTLPTMLQTLSLGRTTGTAICNTNPSHDNLEEAYELLLGASQMSEFAKDVFAINLAYLFGAESQTGTGSLRSAYIISQMFADGPTKLEKENRSDFESLVSTLERETFKIDNWIESFPPASVRSLGILIAVLQDIGNRSDAALNANITSPLPIECRTYWSEIGQAFARDSLPVLTAARTENGNILSDFAMALKASSSNLEDVIQANREVRYGQLLEESGKVIRNIRSFERSSRTISLFNYLDTQRTATADLSKTIASKNSNRSASEACFFRPLREVITQLQSISLEFPVGLPSIL